MKYWIMTLFYLYERMERLCARVDEEIDAMSCDLRTQTYRLFETVLALTDKRTRLVNFRVIGGMLARALTAEQAEIMGRRVRGETLDQIAEHLGISVSTLLRRIRRIETACATVCKGLNYDVEQFEKEYRDIPLVYRTVQRFRKKGRTVAQS